MLLLDMICKSLSEMTHPGTLPRFGSQDLALALQSGYSLPLLLSSHGLNAAGPGPLPLHAALGLPSLELPKVRAGHNEMPTILNHITCLDTTVMLFSVAAVELGHGHGRSCRATRGRRRRPEHGRKRLRGGHAARVATATVKAAGVSVAGTAAGRS